MGETFNIDTDTIIDSAVKEAFEMLGLESITIKSEYFKVI